MNRIVTIVLLLLTPVALFCQDFTGIVLDKATNQPMSFAQIYFVDLKTGTVTDETGQFKIPKSHLRNIHLQISFVGYKVRDEMINLDSIKEMTFYLVEGHFELEEVVVSAPAGRLQGDNIVSVAHVSIEELKQTSPLTLSEAISNIPGVDQNTTGAGIGKPVIRGLSGNRIVTYAQGIRIENQQWGDEHGLGVGEAGIESVEVIKGPASLLYGSDALGGVLYFIDERYAGYNTIEGFVETKFLSNTLGSINNVGLKVHRGQLKFNLFGTYASHADYKAPKLDRVYNTRFNEGNIKGALGFNTRTWISNLRYSFLKNSFGIVEDREYTNSKDRKPTLPFQTIQNNNISFENVFFAGRSKFNLTVGFTNNYRREFEDDVNAHALGLKLNTFTVNAKWHSRTYNNRFDVIIGTQGMAQSNLNTGEEVLIPDANTTDIGAFALVNFHFDKLKLQGGIRADYRDIDTEEMKTDEVEFNAFKNTYNGITFSAGGAYNIDKTKLRMNISSGFRAPNTSELLSNGVHEGTNRYERGNINLVSENATQVDFTYQYQSEHFSFSINPFFNAIQNYIYLSPADTVIQDSPVYDYLQTNAFLYGGEVGVHYHPHKIHWLHLESNLSTVLAEDKNGNPLPLIPQTKINTTVSTEFSTNGKVQLRSVYLQHVYKFNQSRVGQFETPTNAYNIVNIGLKVEVETKNEPIRIETGIRNLLNTKYIDHLSRFKELDIPNQGINVYIGIKLSLSTKLEQ